MSFVSPMRLRPSRWRDFPLKTSALLNDESPPEPPPVAFDHDSFCAELLSGDQFLALDHFHSFHASHPFDCQSGRQSLSLLLDAAAGALPLPAALLPRSLVVLSLLCRRLPAASAAADHPSFVPSLLCFAFPDETVAVLSALSQFPKACRRVSHHISVERLLGLARLRRGDAPFTRQLMRIVFFYSRLRDLEEHTVSDIFAFAHFCLVNGSMARVHLPVESVANLTKAHGVVPLVERFGFISLCNELLWCLEKTTVVAALQFFLLLSRQTSVHLRLLDLERLTALLSARAGDVQLAALEVWNAWIECLARAEPGRLSTMVARFRLNRRLCLIVDGGYFKAKMGALRCLAVLVRVLPVESLIVCSEEFVEAICGVFMVGEDWEGSVVVPGLQMLLAILGKAEKEGSRRMVETWIGRVMDEETVKALLESDDAVVRECAMEVFGLL
jgi:hypothetical protein